MQIFDFRQQVSKFLLELTPIPAASLAPPAKLPLDVQVQNAAHLATRDSGAQRMQRSDAYPAFLIASLCLFRFVTSSARM